MTPDQNPPKCPHLWVERVDGYFDCSFCKETCLDPEAGNQTPPVDTAALAEAAETKVLPRPPEGYRILEVGEKIHTGDKFVGIRLEFSQGFDTHCAGETVPNHTDGLYFRRIDPVPHTAPKCDSCGGAGFHSDVGHAPGEECSHCEGSGTVPHTDPRISDESPAGLVMGALAESLNSLAPQAPAPVGDGIQDDTAAIQAIINRRKAPEGSSPKAHSPTPWFVRFGGNYPEGPFYDITLEDRDYAPSIATLCARKDTKENAEFIVACVNSHSKLTAQVSTLTDALTKAQGILTDYLVPDGIEAKEALSRLLVLLDAPALVQALKGGGA